MAPATRLPRARHPSQISSRGLSAGTPARKRPGRQTGTGDPADRAGPLDRPQNPLRAKGRECDAKAHDAGHHQGETTATVSLGNGEVQDPNQDQDDAGNLQHTLHDTASPPGGLSQVPLDPKRPSNGHAGPRHLHSCRPLAKPPAGGPRRLLPAKVRRFPKEPSAENRRPTARPQRPARCRGGPVPIRSRGRRGWHRPAAAPWPAGIG